MPSRYAETSYSNNLEKDEVRGMQTPKKPSEIVLCISGMAGCGKSTVAKKIARKYGLRYCSGGDALKSLAPQALAQKGETRNEGWWESEAGRCFLEKRTHDFSFDMKVDDKMLESATRGNVVLDSWTMPWLLKKGFKIWLEASPEERARRIAGRDNLSYKKALSALIEKESKTKAIFKKLYSISLGEDFSPFHLIIDVNELDHEEVYKALVLVIDRLVYAPIEASQADAEK